LKKKGSSYITINLQYLQAKKKKDFPVHIKTILNSAFYLQKILSIFDALGAVQQVFRCFSIPNRVGVSV